MRTIVYIDGFNLYYGCLRDTAHRWLNLMQLCQRLLPKNEITQIKYFTARVKPYPSDSGKPTRQNVYLRALETIPELTIYYGLFLSHSKRLPRTDTIRLEQPTYVAVTQAEEKGSDVNITTQLLVDGYEDHYDVAVIISNDSDLIMPIEVITKKLKKPVGIVNPCRKESHSKELQQAATFYRIIRHGILQSSQFPIRMKDKDGKRIHKPEDW